METEKTEKMPAERKIFDYASNLSGAEKPANTLFEIAVSWAAMLLALTCAACIAWRIPADRPVYYTIFRDFKTTLSRITEFMLSIPDAVFPVVAGLLALAIIAAQWLARNKSVAAIFHMLIILLCGVFHIFYRESLFLPLVSLTQSISGPPVGR